MLVVEFNVVLLFYCNVCVIDLFFVCIIFEIVGIMLLMLVLISILIVIGIIDLFVDVLNMVVGWVLLCWYLVVFGLLIGGLCEYSEFVERFWYLIFYF